MAYRSTYGRFNHLYEVEAVKDAPNLHVGDYELVLPAKDVPYFDDFLLRARRYWSDGQKAAPEILLDSPIRILRRF